MLVWKNTGQFVGIINGLENDFLYLQKEKHFPWENVRDDDIIV